MLNKHGPITVEIKIKPILILGLLLVAVSGSSLLIVSFTLSQPKQQPSEGQWLDWAETITLRIRIGPVPKYLKENTGSPLILTFILSLIFAAATYSAHATLANDIVTKTFLLLIAGIILQVIALARKGSPEEH